MTFNKYYKLAQQKLARYMSSIGGFLSTLYTSRDRSNFIKTTKMIEEEPFSLVTEFNPYEYADLDVRGEGTNIVAFHKNAAEEIKRGVLGALATYQLRNRSIDYTIKNYGREWNFENSEDKISVLIRQSTEEVQEVINRNIRRLYSFDPSPDGVGMVAAQTALGRLRASFESATTLIRFGFCFESVAIIRLILEQVAWSYAVHNVVDSQVAKTKPSSSITVLKRALPKVGRLYGVLSNLTHMNSGAALHYLEIDEGETIIIIRSPEAAALGAFFLIHVADIYSVTSEVIFQRYFTDYAFISQMAKEPGWRLIKSRPTQKLISRYSKKLTRVVRKALRARRAKHIRLEPK